MKAIGSFEQIGILFAWNGRRESRGLVSCKVSDQETKENSTSNMGVKLESVWRRAWHHIEEVLAQISGVGDIVPFKESRN